MTLQPLGITRHADTSIEREATLPPMPGEERAEVDPDDWLLSEKRSNRLS